MNKLLAIILTLTLIWTVGMTQEEETKLVPIDLKLPKPMFVGTPQNLKVPNLEKPLGNHLIMLKGHYQGVLSDWYKSEAASNFQEAS